MIGRTTSRILRLISLARAIHPAVDFYQGSWPLAARRVVRVFMREGVNGVVRRAHILAGKPMARRNGRFLPSDKYGDVLPPDAGFTPRVSVIVPNFNHAEYLRQRLDSIYDQTYPNMEIILLDDCSSDASLSILQEYASRYPDRTICHFNTTNSGSAFSQWRKGIELATGELLWIAESDDYCSETFLHELVGCFQNEAVKLAFGHTEFVRGTPPVRRWSTTEYLQDLHVWTWDRPFIRSAHAMVKFGWTIKNILPNVSGAIFRHPGRLALLDDPVWLSLRLCGDWMFYLSIIRGGLVAYSPHAINYYRQHPMNTSVEAQKEDVYYREFELVARHIVRLYRVDRTDLHGQEQALYDHWCSRRGSDRDSEFKALYSLDRIWPLATERRPNVMIAVYALAAGGGETFPIMMANLLEQKGYAVTLFNCAEQATESGVRTMLSPTIPLLELERIELAAEAFADMGVELVHSHHAWVDVSLATFLLGDPGIRQLVTMHGMYEMMTPAQLEGLLPVLRRRIDAFVYTADKNLEAFPADFRAAKDFHRIDNALPETAISPVSRDELKIAIDDFVLCLVARAIPEKGWEEAIRAVAWANERSSRNIRLLLIGEGPEFDRLRSEHPSGQLQFLGFRTNIRDYFAASDIGFLPSRFKGESAPLVVIDCLRSGRPVLASNVGEIRHMLDAGDGVAGVLFDLKDWEIDVPAVGQMIASLADDEQRYRELKSRVPAAAAKFDLAAMLEKYENIYRDILAGTEA
ncbi:glycosyltransferase [Bradyrhizobium diazoefficiens]|nr:glycosyltransferase [Bradyrhizobium diazoefficiens]MBR0774553.1 glycosyltransferase [Bradyrhizobium diazoefficiens]